ncbi:hypothetical protein L207DRAFT_433023 [Hyaloscypha variabilis F]|uniref:Uncharacterized protein n=1 Tax=Hyaloscypha variabilis (strain UAMH 11265 / GT02V1 / F) TaxID=1149755 RepID=A0A2J6RF39_HYAVF|nr:hypothetical protein L207DRAFT_433023 [Hyaloscypha variabilis F]
MKPPAVTRFEEIIDITPFPFPGAVEVTGLGNISDALVGRLAWDSLVVQEEAKFWLIANWQEVNNSYSSFKVKALTTIKRCWGWV